MNEGSTRRSPDGTSPDPKPTADGRTPAGLDGVLARVVLAGLAVAVLLLVAGTVIAGARQDESVPRESSLRDIPRALAALEPGGFFDLGLVVLVAVPVLGVLVLGAGYARRREWPLAALSVFVAAVVLVSAFLGLRG
jgi:uncharacterized membrane protein